MSGVRRAVTLLVLLTALAAGGVGIAVGSPIADKQPILTWSDAAWLRSLLIGYFFGTLLVPFGLADIREPVGKTLKIWGLMLLVALLVWLLPLAFAKTFAWDNDSCLSASLVIMLLPTLLDPLLMFRRRSVQIDDEV